MVTGSIQNNFEDSTLSLQSTKWHGALLSKRYAMVLNFYTDTQVYFAGFFSSEQNIHQVVRLSGVFNLRPETVETVGSFKKELKTHLLLPIGSLHILEAIEKIFVRRFDPSFALRNSQSEILLYSAVQPISRRLIKKIDMCLLSGKSCSLSGKSHVLAASYKLYTVDQSRGFAVYW